MSGEPERGAPTTYRKIFDRQARVVCAKGATEEDLADIFNVCLTTIGNWKKEHPDFLRAIENGKRKADAKVEKSLYQRAIGYKHKSEKLFQYEGEVIRGATIEKYPPDVSAASLWLRNRRPDKWRDKHDLDHSGGVSVNHVTASMPAEKLKAIREIMLSEGGNVETKGSESHD